MAIPYKLTQENINDAYKKLEKSPESVRLNFCENTPVNKMIFKLIPEIDIAIDRISYGFGSTDLSVNGYISLVISRVENPNYWAVAQSNSQIIFDRITGANSFDNGEMYFFNPLVIKANEPMYVYLVSNMPNGTKALGKLVLYYHTLHL